MKPVVLVYHGVGFAADKDPRRLITSPEHLVEHVRLLLGRGYRFVPAGELSQEGPAEGWTTERIKKIELRRGERQSPVLVLAIERDETGRGFTQLADAG